MRARSFTAVLASIGLAAIAGCYLPEDEVVAEGARCGEVGVRAAGLRLLTRAEYDATVRDLLGDDAHLARDFPKEPLAFGFENNAEVLRVTAEGAQRYLDAAEVLATRAIRERREAVTTCGALTDLACAEHVLDTFGRRAFRRKLTDDEKARFLDLYRRGTMGGETADGGLEMVITAMLQSPQFLYRTESGEIGEGEAPRRLTSYEIASRLSYFLWGTMPDEDLLASAEQGRLATQAGVRAEAERMMDDPRAHAGVMSFFRQYLSLETMQAVEKDTRAYPAFSNALAQSWRTSLERYVDDVFWEGKSLKALLTSPTVYADAQFAAAYAMPAAKTGDFARLTMPQNQYAGLLAQPGMMARLAGPNQSSPVRRGVFVFDKLLCQPLPSPPAELNVTAPEPNPNATTRERFDVHSKNGVCAGCHKMIDPMGFGIEEYDGVGAYRDRENGKAVDNSGEIVGTRDTALLGKFSGARELGEKLARSRQVHDCFAVQYVRFALGRSEKPQDECSLQQVQGAFYSSGGNFRTLLVGIAVSDSFRFRSAPVKEGSKP